MHTTCTFKSIPDVKQPEKGQEGRSKRDGGVRGAPEQKQWWQAGGKGEEISKIINTVNKIIKHL